MIFVAFFKAGTKYQGESLTNKYLTGNYPNKEHAEKDFKSMMPGYTLYIEGKEGLKMAEKFGMEQLLI